MNLENVSLKRMQGVQEERLKASWKWKDSGKVLASSSVRLLYDAHAGQS